MKKNKETSTNSINRNFLTDCNLTYAAMLIGGRWKLPILMRIQKGYIRFGELKKVIPNITERMLTLQLKELERDGIVLKKVHMEVPLRIEYGLTTIGNELIPVCKELHQWGAKHKLVHLERESTLLE
jgi:DNA-binding HxlR family transcriptional regulator